MKKCLLVVITIQILLTSCNQNDSYKNFNRKLDSAELLMEDKPDSVLTILSSLKNIINSDDKTRVRYNLIKIEAEDKCYISHSSDSIILNIVNYLDQHGSPIQKMKAYYLLGRVYSDMQLTGESINAYKNSINIECDDNTETYAIRSRANNWIAQTLMFQNMYEDAYKYFVKSYHFAKLSHNTTIEIYVLRDIGRCLVSLNKVNKGLYYFKKSSLLALKSKNKRIYDAVMSELAYNYMNIKQYSLAKQALDMSVCKEDSVYDNSCLARYYYETGKMDSAIIYYKKCLLIKAPYFYICENAALKLSKIYSATNNYVMANVCLRQSMVCDDSLSQNIFKQNSNLIKKLNEKLEYERRLDAEAKMHSFIVFTIILLFVIFLFVTIYYVRNKQVKNKNQREKVKRIISELHIRGNDIIIKNDLRISQLKNEISLLNNKIDKFKKSMLQAEREKLITENARIESASKLRNLRVMNFMCSEIYMSFHSNNFHPTELNYFELEKLENETFDNCIDKIREMNNSINNNEIKICILIKADIPLKMIALYLDYVLNALSMVRMRLYFKLFKQKGTATQLDEFIKGL